MNSRALFTFLALCLPLTLGGGCCITTGSETTCDDGIDNDCDGYPDCFDMDCACVNSGGTIPNDVCVCLLEEDEPVCFLEHNQQNCRFTDDYHDGDFGFGGRYPVLDIDVCIAGCAQFGYLKTVRTGVVIDDSSYTITNAEVADAVSYASDLLFQRSGAVMNLQAITHVPSVTGSMQAEIDAYYTTHATDPPHFVVVFSRDDFSVSAGGYAQTSSDLSSLGFCNEFVSPVLGTSRVYGAVIDWTHRFGVCGYDLDHYEATGDYLWISTTSLADGTCQNQAGISCVYNSVVDYRVCGNVDPGVPYLQHPKAFIASMFVHELLHSFGTNGNLDHFGTATCDVAMGGVDYGAGDLATSQEFAGMCPNVWETFAYSYATCP